MVVDGTRFIGGGFYMMVIRIPMCRRESKMSKTRSLELPQW